MSNFMDTNENKCYQKWSFYKLNALKMSEITVFDVMDEEVAVLPSFLKVLFEFSAYDSFITKTGNTLQKT
jgi:hypothetical protein